jgi:hypothetical protein
MSENSLTTNRQAPKQALNKKNSSTFDDLFNKETRLIKRKVLLPVPVQIELVHELVSAHVGTPDKNYTR